MIAKLRQLRDDAVRDGTADPAFFKELDDMENHLLGDKPAKLFPGTDKLNSFPEGPQSMN